MFIEVIDPETEVAALININVIEAVRAADPRESEREGCVMLLIQGELIPVLGTMADFKRKLIAS